ncbi:MAG: class I SAM-dependent methyltransferase [Prevotellaceae bacterium]|jgi:2-polyprenyl-3-methyl-5-hydroxy-6-metoxy-1,4-benzoquinol methylase|nr:class I SAM-dependent methyltransferase [Prevotellaceae bacterium]
MTNQYDNYLAAAFEGEGQYEPKIKQFFNNYYRFFPKEKTARILDIGPGRGEMLTCLANQGFSNIESVDISESVVKFVSQLGYKISKSDDLEIFLSSYSDTFDMITMCDVVEHIPKNQILGVMEAVRKSLKDAGLLIVQVPNMQSVTANIFRYDDFTHEMGYTERSLTQMLKIVGFSTITNYGFEFFDNKLSSKIKSVLRSCLWLCVKIIRKINGTMPHRIMHPVFFAIVKK